MSRPSKIGVRNGAPLGQSAPQLNRVSAGSVLVLVTTLSKLESSIGSSFSVIPALARACCRAEAFAGPS